MEAGMRPHGETVKCISMENIIQEVNRLGNRRAAKKYLKKFGLSWDEYLDMADPYLRREVEEAVEQRAR